MRDETYNGWTNHETWCVNLWIGNEEPSYCYWRGVAQECMDEADASEHLTRKEVAERAFAELLKEQLEEASPLAEGGTMWSDLLGSALSAVNWDEIARAWLEEVEPSTADEAVEADD